MSEGTVVVSAEVEASLKRLSTLQEIEAALVLDDDDCAAYGAQEIVQWKKVIETIETERDKILAPQKAAVEATKQFFNPRIDDAKKAIENRRKRLVEYNRVKAEKIRLENERIERERREARQRAEAEAAAELAKANERIAAAKAEAERLEKEAQEARERGEHAKAAQAAASAAKAAEKAAATEENAVAKAEAIHAQAGASMPVAQQTEKVAGMSGRTTYAAALGPGILSASQAVEKIVKAIAGGRRELLPLLNLNMVEANKLASFSKTNFNVPGLTYVVKESVSVRASK